MKEINLQELNFEIQAGDLNGVLYEDENREVKKPLQEKKIDSWDRPDTLPPVEPFYIERYEDKKK